MVCKSQLQAITLTILALSSILCPADAEQSENRGISRICVTEWSGYYNSSQVDFEKRFSVYKKMRVDTIRVESGWLDHQPLVNALKNSAFHIKMIVYVLGMSPSYSANHLTDRMVDEHGVADWHLGPWSAGFGKATLDNCTLEMKKLRASGLADRVNEIVVDLGPAGEGIYPANWTVNDRKGEEALWCYSQRAQDSFRRAMREKYTRIEAAMIACGTGISHPIATWQDLTIPPPRTSWAKGAFWDDMLVWYRDSKRRMILQRIEQTQRVARDYLGSHAKCIVYLPGYSYSQADWDAAVSEASGPASIRLMMDNDWLMTTAIAHGCVLQYTGVENVDEVRNIARKLKAAGSSAYKTMWGENAGYEGTGRNPGWLATVITTYGLRGVDYTWSNWLFEKDGVTPSKTALPFAYSAGRIAAYYSSGRLLPEKPRQELIHRVDANRWSLDCQASTRLMGNYPDVIKGGDPEIAAVEGGQSQKMLLQFPFDGLPKSRRIRSAKLTMKRYLAYADDQSSEELGVYLVTSPWSSASATWKESEPGVAWRHAGGDSTDANGVTFVSRLETHPWAVSKAPVFTKAGDNVTWDITALVKQLVSKTVPNHGLLIALIGNAAGNKSFASCTHADPTMRPMIVVEFASE